MASVWSSSSKRCAWSPEGGRPLVEVARELTIQPEQLRGWRRKFEGAGAVPRAPRGKRPRGFKSLPSLARAVQMR